MMTASRVRSLIACLLVVALTTPLLAVDGKKASELVSFELMEG